ncbi:hypothetical protein F4804DRAFT_315780 [Jackrogersella minutella]|nr:hypothetical protein F4804DRAFT_315780 [Jackrogersella minutella]
MPSNTYSSSSVSFTSSTTRNGETAESRYAQHTTSDPSGTKTDIASQNAGQPIRHERYQYDTSGRLISSEGQSLGGSANSGRRIEDVSDEQRKNDKLYEERIEDEYAKREGGA